MLSEEQQKLVEDNINLVFYIIHKYNFPMDDSDIGFIALCKAAKTFDTSKGYTFSTYAAKCIRNEYHSMKKRMDRRFQVLNTLSLDVELYSDSEGNPSRLMDVIPDPYDMEADMVWREFSTKYSLFVMKLPESKQEILALWHAGIIQSEIAERTGHSQANISRIIRNLHKRFLRENYPNISLLDLEEEMKLWQKK